MNPVDPAATEDLTARLREVIDIHFDPVGGTPYWLDRQERLHLDARREICTLSDLALLGPMDAGAMARRPIEDFLPRAMLHRRAELILAETGGTLGPPKFAVHRIDEFESAFVEPFVAAARRAGFPRGENWLYVGPTGPHIIGKAARRCAQATGSPDCFTVDFDPRWARKMPPDAFSRRRYLRHIEDQALGVLRTQHIGVLFSTPPVLASLCRRIDPAVRAGIRGVHFGGMPVATELRNQLAGLLPAAVMLAGYGNTLFGMMPELAYNSQTGIDYYPLGMRHVVQVVEREGLAEADRMRRMVAAGERGQIVVHRLDHMQLIPNMFERDTAVRIGPLADARPDGFVLDGIRDPQPIVAKSSGPAVGLY